MATKRVPSCRSTSWQTGYMPPTTLGMPKAGTKSKCLIHKDKMHHLGGSQQANKVKALGQCVGKNPLPSHSSPKWGKS